MSALDATALATPAAITQDEQEQVYMLLASARDDILDGDLGTALDFIDRALGVVSVAA
jgi:hypothetical protein